ncbi:hypothetical protein NDU88_005784 [Pleurodeles waltl]|uniref:Uncharacterized protein n=1 Tax=Pleurodeles waltl TaxID=8319 RepID=A0AAV7WZ89_PLEWA|nr:hypothetical protein NDU88_005784 [Pleurodeles waltl]
MGWLPHIAPSDEALSDQPSTSKGNSKAKTWAHSNLFKKLASSIQKEHGYSSSQAQDAYGSDSDQSSSKPSSESDSEEDLGDRLGPSKRKKSETAKAPPPKAPRVLTFSPEEIIHPRSSSWAPPSEVAEYLQNHIRAGFDKDVRARLRAECPRPDLEDTETSTPQKARLFEILLGSPRDEKQDSPELKIITKCWKSYLRKIRTKTPYSAELTLSALQAITQKRSELELRELVGRW